MNLSNIFPNESDRNEAIERFRSLKDNPDWIFLVEKLIKWDIEDLTQKLLDPKTDWKEGEEKEMKRIRSYWIILSQLPEELIKALSSNSNDFLIEYDLYFKNIKEIKKR